MIKTQLIFFFFLIATAAYTQNDPMHYEQHIEFQQPTIDPYSQFLAIMEINELGSADRLVSRSDKTHVLDSIISVSIYDDFFLKTEFFWEEEKLTELYFKKIFQTNDWIPSGCSEYGINSNNQITYHHSLTCDGAAPSLSREYFYDLENKLERFVAFSTLVVSGNTPTHRGTTYEYDENDFLVRSESYDILQDSLEVDNYVEYNYDNEGRLVSWVGYSLGVLDSVFRKSDSLSISFTDDGRLDTISSYYFRASDLAVPFSLRNLDYNEDGLLIKNVSKSEFSYVQNEYDEIESTELVYSEGILKDITTIPSRKNGNDLSNGQIYDQTLFSTYAYDTSIYLEDIIFERDYLEPRPFLDSLNRSRHYSSLRKHMLNEQQFYVGWLLTYDADYYYSALSSSTEELELERVYVSPNPTTDLVNIHHPDHNISRVCLYDISGQQIKVYENGACSLAGLLPGIYLAEIWISGVGRVVERIVKQ